LPADLICWAKDRNMSKDNLADFVIGSFAFCMEDEQREKRNSSFESSFPDCGILV